MVSRIVASPEVLHPCSHRLRRFTDQPFDYSDILSCFPKRDPGYSNVFGVQRVDSNDQVLFYFSSASQPLTGYIAPGRQPIDPNWSKGAGEYYTMGAVLTYYDSYPLLTTSVIDENENFKKLYYFVSSHPYQ